MVDTSRTNPSRDSQTNPEDCHKKTLHAPENKVPSAALSVGTKPMKRCTYQRTSDGWQQEALVSRNRCFRNSRSRKHSSDCMWRGKSTTNLCDVGRMSRSVSTRRDSSDAPAKRRFFL